MNLQPPGSPNRYVALKVFIEDLTTLEEMHPDLVIFPLPTCVRAREETCQVVVSDPTHPFKRALDPLDERGMVIGNPFTGAYMKGELFRQAAELPIFRRIPRTPL